MKNLHLSVLKGTLKQFSITLPGCWGTGLKKKGLSKL